MKITDYGHMIRFSHSVFALPFALASALYAIVREGMSPEDAVMKFFWIVIAMIGARSAAMGFNRIADRHLDALNPRTAEREIPSGKISVPEAVLFVVFSSIVFSAAALMLNPCCFYLSFPVLGVLLGYSYVKRFWQGSHFVLGLSLGIAPSGAWLAVTGTLDAAPVLLSAAVALWTAGFDIIYALQDTDFDRRMNLHSVPADSGSSSALTVSRVCHLLMLVFLIAAGRLFPGGKVLSAGMVLIAGFVIYEHVLVLRSHDNIGKAFFNMNAGVSVTFLVISVLDLLVEI